jgi:hypothetical protein
VYKEVQTVYKQVRGVCDFSLVAVASAGLAASSPLRNPSHRMRRAFLAAGSGSSAHHQSFALKAKAVEAEQAIRKGASVALLVGRLHQTENEPAAQVHATIESNKCLRIELDLIYKNIEKTKRAIRESKAFVLMNEGSCLCVECYASVLHSGCL